MESDEEVLAYYRDSQSKVEAAVHSIEDRALRSIELHRPSWDTVFTFDDKIVLRTFSAHSKKSEDWMLYTPDGNVLSIGPGPCWSYESAFISRPFQE